MPQKHIKFAILSSTFSQNRKRTYQNGQSFITLRLRGELRQMWSHCSHPGQASLDLSIQLHYSNIILGHWLTEQSFLTPEDPGLNPAITNIPEKFVFTVKCIY